MIYWKQYKSKKIIMVVFARFSFCEINVPASMTSEDISTVSHHSRLSRTCSRVSKIPTVEHMREV